MLVTLSIYLPGLLEKNATATFIVQKCVPECYTDLMFLMDSGKQVFVQICGKCFSIMENGQKKKTMCIHMEIVKKCIQIGGWKCTLSYNEKCKEFFTTIVFQNNNRQAYKLRNNMILDIFCRIEETA